MKSWCYVKSVVELKTFKFRHRNALLNAWNSCRHLYLWKLLLTECFPEKRLGIFLCIWNAVTRERSVPDTFVSKHFWSAISFRLPLACGKEEPKPELCKIERNFKFHSQSINYHNRFRFLMPANSVTWHSLLKLANWERFYFFFYFYLIKLL